MIKKLEYKKEFKQFYLPRSTPQILEVENMVFLGIKGNGDPNGAVFERKIKALFQMSYKIKIAYKKNQIDETLLGSQKSKYQLFREKYFDYTVFPLEAIWSLSEEKGEILKKDQLEYTLMIRQPDFVTPQLIDFYRLMLRKENDLQDLEALYFQEIQEGSCCQILHVGSYDEEPVSFKKMEEFCKQNDLIRKSEIHREIYLSNPGRTSNEKLRTILRFQVRRNKCDSVQKEKE